MGHQREQSIKAVRDTYLATSVISPTYAKAGELSITESWVCAPVRTCDWLLAAEVVGVAVRGGRRDCKLTQPLLSRKKQRAYNHIREKWLPVASACKELRNEIQRMV